MKKVPETKIGTLQVKESEPMVLFLHCFCAEAGKLTIDILSEQGTTYRTFEATLPNGPQKVDFNLGQLPPGRYNAWISLNQVSGIRNFTISRGSSFKDRLSSWIKG